MNEEYRMSNSECRRKGRTFLVPASPIYDVRSKKTYYFLHTTFYLLHTEFLYKELINGLVGFYEHLLEKGAVVFSD